MDLELPEELRLLQSSVRKFVDETLAPHEKEVEEKDEIPRALISPFQVDCGPEVLHFFEVLPAQ